MAYKTHSQHFYSFSFTRLHEDGGQTVASSYIASDSQKITKAVIDFARDLSKIDEGAVLTAVCYLGYMSEAEFHAPL